MTARIHHGRRSILWFPVNEAQLLWNQERVAALT
jgi:hypothetical protein